MSVDNSDSDKNPNPQGKGQALVLRDLQAFTNSFPIVPKELKQVSDEWFTALFILHSDCSFKPVPGGSYYLYRIDSRYQLLMTAPNAWFGGPPGDYMAQCDFLVDLSWSLQLSEFAKKDSIFQSEVKQAKVDFEHHLEDAESLEEALPFHSEALAYHQRVMAYGLAKSLQASMELKGYAKLSYREAMKQLET